ncbi:MAG TPA: hypothetical protein PLU39_10715 [Armatimonadota bacterium]|nr:hypothetical protein [Armatimonadota bacterium]
MRPRTPVSVACLALALLASSAPMARAEITLLDGPIVIFPGQSFRVALEQPAGSGDLDAAVPPTLELFDRWPKDSIQRFYFRALAPGDATLRFHGQAGELTLSLKVTPWSEVLQPRQWNKIDFPRIWPMAEPGLRELKTRRTLHSPEEIAAIKAGGKPGAIARKWHALSDEEIWNIIPGACVPRTCLMVLSPFEDARGKGCPVCGPKIYEGRNAFYPWRIDPEGHPWKVGCPSCNTWFPSNDFAKGDMHSGDFPDDGYGCEPARPVISPNGKPWRWPFIAYYHQWAAYMDHFSQGIPQCAEASIITGDRTYARKAAIALFRISESLLDLAVNMNHRKIPVRNGVYQPPIGAPDAKAMARVAGSFLYIQPNWDTPRLESYARAWDLIFDQLEGDEALLEFCRAHHHPEIRTLEDFRWFIESGILRVAAQACLDDAVSRNYPMQEATVATLALALGTPRASELADWVINGPGGIRFGLSNEFFKDGSGHESESYNAIGIRDMERLFLTLERLYALDPERYRPPRFPSLLKDPKYPLLFHFPLANSLIGRTYPSTGDTGGPRTAPSAPSQGYPLSQAQFVEVYRRTRDPRFAQALYGPAGEIPSALHEPELRAEVERIGKERGWQVQTKSNFLDGYGHAILRSGTGDRQRALWLRYGRALKHLHYDMLTFGLSALQRNLLPELGYPQGWTYASVWEFSWGTHYGTHITGVATSAFPRGQLTLFADSPPAQVAVAEASTGPGKDDAWRQRTLVLVDLPGENCYAVTLERVRGGQEHLHSFHGPDGEATLFGLSPKPQGGGTVLGTDIAYGDVSKAGHDRELAILAYLPNPSRDRPAAPWGMDVALRNQKDVRVRMTMMHPLDAEVALAEGRPPGGGSNAYRMPFAISKRMGDAPLRSQFLMVIEPYEGARVVERVEPMAVTPLGGAPAGEFAPLGVRITTPEFVDTLILQPDASGACRTADGLVCRGEVGFWRERRNGAGQTPAAAVLAGGSQLAKGAARLEVAHPVYTGRITRCDWAKRTVVVSPAPPAGMRLVGQHLQIRNDAGSHVSYVVEAARPVEGGCALTLELDPRVGEGVVKSYAAGTLESQLGLRLAPWGYYAGKTLANEDGSTFYRLRDVERGNRLVLEAQVPAEGLKRDFSDRDGDGLTRYVIYDYGPGDEVILRSFATLASQ